MYGENGYEGKDKVAKDMCMLGLKGKGVGYGEEGLRSKLCYHG
jgi:hypothetical protein